jgi:hypothetical protein
VNTKLIMYEENIIILLVIFTASACTKEAGLGIDGNGQQKKGAVNTQQRGTQVEIKTSDKSAVLDPNGKN